MHEVASIRRNTDAASWERIAGIERNTDAVSRRARMEAIGRVNKNLCNLRHRTLAVLLTYF
jgi:hypothetical protein